MLVEVGTKSLCKILLAHHETELLHRCCSFMICYSIKYWVSYISVCNDSSNRMGCHHLILEVSSSFRLKEACPRRLKRYCLQSLFYPFKAKVRNECCKGLVKPKIIPPLHCHQVSKPVMRKFVRYCARNCKHFLIRHFVPKETRIFVDDSSCIFHCAPFILMSEYLIVFSKGKGVVEELLIKFHGANCYFKNKGGLLLKKRIEGLNAEQRHRNVLDKLRSTLYYFSF